MLRKTIRAIGWIAASLVALVVVLYLGALALNWRDREPSATAVLFTEQFDQRPAVADADNGYVHLRRWDSTAGRRDQLPPRVQQFVKGCSAGETECAAAAFDSADGIFNEWHAAESSLLDNYLALTAHTGWREPNSFSIEDSLPPYQGVMDGQRLLLLQARELAKRGDAPAVRVLLDRDLQFWRMALQSSDILISRMIATVALDRHFEFGYRAVRLLPAPAVVAAIPEGWRRGMSDAELSITRCMVGEWMYVSNMLRDMDRSQLSMSEDATMVERMIGTLERPMFQLQDTKNRVAEQYRQVAQTLNVPLDRYEDAMRRADELTVRMNDEAGTSGAIYNRVGLRLLANVGSYSQYAARVGDIEGVRRAALLAATLRATGTKHGDMPAALANTELRDPYTDRPFGWDASDGAIVFRGLEAGDRGEHRLSY